MIFPELKSRGFFVARVVKVVCYFNFFVRLESVPLFSGIHLIVRIEKDKIKLQNYLKEENDEK